MKNNKTSIIFDTNIFNSLLDNTYSLNNTAEALEILTINYDIYITHIQKDELTKTRNNDRREKLLQISQAIFPVNVPTSSMVYGISVYGEALYSNGEIFKSLLLELNKNKSEDAEKNNPKDALIGETAILNKLVLVTHDKYLFSAITKHHHPSSNLPTLLNSKPIVTPVE